MRHQGRITQWNDAKGFGFITPNGGGAKVFLHASEMAPDQRRPRGDELVHYEVAFDDRRRPQARAVQYVGRARPRGLPALGAIVAPAAAVVFFAFLAGETMRGRLPGAVPAWYAIASVVTFLLYRHDKRAAERRAWRVPEANLHLAGFLGGWPGALMAQRWLRHKSSKPSFQFGFFATLALNLLALAALAYGGGAAVLRATLH